MKNTLGHSLTLTLYGESHGTAIGAVLDGLAPGIAIHPDEIARQMERRHGLAALSTPRREADFVCIESGVWQGKTTGTPLCLSIRNENTRSSDYTALQDLPRPSHADLTAQQKYHGFSDPRGGGHFSGRLTAPLTAAGAIVYGALRSKGIRILTHVQQCAGICDRPFSDLAEDAQLLADAPFAVLDEKARQDMICLIEDAKHAKDSVGGILETIVTGVPAGVGEPWFDTVEGALANALFSVPAVKGVSFGAGFAFASMRGSAANDPIILQDGKIRTQTNHNGGVCGGITNGMPILFQTVIKPTPSIFQPQQTVNLQTMQPQTLCISGRHDPAIVARAAAPIDAVTALVLADLLTLRFGTDYLAGGDA